MATILFYCESDLFSQDFYVSIRFAVLADVDSATFSKGLSRAKVVQVMMSVVKDPQNGCADTSEMGNREGLLFHI